MKTDYRGRRALLVLPTAVAMAIIVFASAATAGADPPRPDGSGLGTIAGQVVDAATGLGLPDARVTVTRDGPPIEVMTTADGAFIISGLPPGTYRLDVKRSGYSETISDDVRVDAGMRVTVTLAVQQSRSTINDPQVIGTTRTRASESLQHSAIIYKSVSGEALQRAGYARAADIIKTLPQVNASGDVAETPAYGDDISLDIRGIGRNETIVLLDGHPIGNGGGFRGYGYNFQLTPSSVLRNIEVAYGSGGSDLVGLNAIGGVVDLQTIEPTVRPQFSLSQSFGTFSQLASSFTATGTTSSGRLGYAVAGSVSGIDGPFKNLSFYQPAAAFDQSAPAGSPVYNLGVYTDDSALVSRSALMKLRYAFGNPRNLDHLTATAVVTSYWDNKTGNGDNDYLPYDTALAVGAQLLASYSAPSPAPTGPFGPSNPPACAAGTFLAKNVNGAPNGFGPNGAPDGGISCQTPQQYAAFNTGYLGAGPAWQQLGFDDYHLRYDKHVGNVDLTADAFTNRYYWTFDRTNALPYQSVPGDVAFWQNFQQNQTGFSVTGNIPGRMHDIGIGYSYSNTAYNFLQNGAPNGTPIVHDTALFVRDAYHPSPHVVAFLNGNFKSSSVTHQAAFDPRISVVFTPSRNNVFRFAVGETTAQPYATAIDVPFSPFAPASFAGMINCAGLNSVGFGSNPALKPERGIDTELGIGHRFHGDSQIQVTLYNANISDKIYSSIAPLSLTGTGFIDPATLMLDLGHVAQRCGDSVAPSLLGLNTQVNLGRLLARGFDISGRARINRALFIDYDYSTELAILQAAPVSLLQQVNTLSIGRQLPAVPMHKASAALDATFGPHVNARLTGYFTGINNAKSRPGYSSFDLETTATVRHGSFNIAVHNLFQQGADFRDALGHGVPLPLNQYATPAQQAANAPIVCGSACELFNLPYRTITLTYRFHS